MPKAREKPKAHGKKETKRYMSLKKTQFSQDTAPYKQKKLPVRPAVSSRVEAIPQAGGMKGEGGALVNEISSGSMQGEGLESMAQTGRKGMKGEEALTVDEGKTGGMRGEGLESLKQAGKGGGMLGEADETSTATRRGGMAGEGGDDSV